MSETTNLYKKGLILSQNLTISGKIGQLRYLSDLFSQEKDEQLRIGQLRSIYSVDCNDNYKEVNFN